MMEGDKVVKGVSSQYLLVAFHLAFDWISGFEYPVSILKSNHANDKKY